jgi:hypothetical protein
MAAGEHPMAMVQHPMAIPWRYVAIPWLSHGYGWIDPGSASASDPERELFAFRFGSVASKSLYKTSVYGLRVTDY